MPEPLRAIIGKREFNKSLGKDHHKAVSQARLLSLQADRQLADARLQKPASPNVDPLEVYLSLPLDKRLKSITQVTPEMVAGLRSLWLRSLEMDSVRRRDGLDDDEYEQLNDNVADMQALLAKAIATGQAEPFIPAVRGLLHGRGYELAVDPEVERLLVYDLIPAARVPRSPCRSHFSIQKKPDYSDCVRLRTDQTQPMNHGTGAWQSPRADIGSANLLRSGS